MLTASYFALFGETSKLLNIAYHRVASERVKKRVIFPAPLHATMGLMKPAPKPIIVRYKKLGRERVLGWADLDTNEIVIDPRQPSRELMGTLVHECIHLLCDDLGKPDWPEERVLEWEEKMADVLWAAGYRKVVD